MKVILIQDVKSQGKKGDLITVSDGYAVNFLFPKKLAIEADAAAINDLKNKEAAKKFKIEEQAKEAKTLAEKLATVKLVITTSASADGRMYGSITNKDIADALQKQHGIEIDKKKIELTTPIKSFGDYTATAKLFTGVTGKIAISINKQN